MNLKCKFGLHDWESINDNDSTINNDIISIAKSIAKSILGEYFNKYYDKNYNCLKLYIDNRLSIYSFNDLYSCNELKTEICLNCGEIKSNRKYYIKMFTQLKKKEVKKFCRQLQAQNLYQNRKGI